MTWMTTAAAGMGLASSALGLGQQAGLFGGSDGWAPSSYSEAMRPMQRGIQWRVADAKKAGIHPLYALGASTPSSPIPSSGNIAPDYSAPLRDAANTLSRYDNQKRTRLIQNKEQARADAITSAQVDQAQANAEVAKARAAQIRAELWQMPANTAAAVEGPIELDPSYMTRSLNGQRRLTAWRRPDGGWQKVDWRNNPPAISLRR